jgi:signal transduction histidine kinase
MARYSGGITGRRMRAVALGTVALGLDIVMAVVDPALPHALRWAGAVVRDGFSLLCGLSYYVGFAPPSWLRRAWQEPELRAFLGRAASLPRLPDTSAIVHELERGAAASLGSSHAVIGLWDEASGELEFGLDGAPVLVDDIARQTFVTQRAAFTDDALHYNPADTIIYRSYHVTSVLSVPITAGHRRLGVLTIYAARAPMFAEDDLTLARLLADQAAVILESRALIDEAARVRAREEATRLKDDFLSAAAHDLKTPLTALVAQAQLMEYRANRDPKAPADVAGIRRMVRESQRLKALITELLDVGRVEAGKLLGARETVALGALLEETCHLHSTNRHPVRLRIDEDVIGEYDPVRIRQLVHNLLDNAVKYSPHGGEVRVELWRDNGEARLTVTDRGIGIPESDLGQLFDRFHRGSNVDDRQFAGMGLGLFICRGIAEQHGGRIWVTSPGPKEGSTFHVALPASEKAARSPVSPAAGERVVESALVAPGETT